MSSSCLQQFAFDLYKVLAACDSGTKDGVFFSPVSVYAALASLLAGTNGESEKQLKKALHVLDEADTNKLHQKLSSEMSRMLTSSASTKTNIANRIFVESGFPLKKSFSELIDKCYSSKPEQVNFSSETEAARTKINQWINEKTEGKIVDLFPQGSIKEATKMVIANALHFKGLWMKPFEKSATKDGKFHLLDGTTKDVKLMYLNEKRMQMCEFEDLTAKAIYLPYKNSELSMFILLPNRSDGLPELMKNLFKTGPRPDGQGDKPFMEMFLDTSLYYTQETNLYLPRLKVGGGGKPSISLIDKMQQLGVHAVFEAGNADFSSLTDQQGLYVSTMLHQAVLDVDEEGAEAAAATGMGIMLMCMQPPPVDFKVTHPFVLAIAHNSGVPLFLGHVCNPN